MTSTMAGSGTRSHDEELSAERARNEQYQARLQALIDRQPEIAKQITATASSAWTQTGPRIALSARVLSPIVGRVALDVDDPLLGTDFYIGSWHEEKDGYTVVSWAAPVAELFFRPDLADDPLADSVTGRRTFTPRGTDLEDFDDERRGRSSGPLFTSSTKVIEVPRAPSAPTRPTVVRPARPRPKPAPRPRPIEPVGKTESPPTPPGPAAVAEVAGERDDIESIPVSSQRYDGLRAARVVQTVLERPRTGQLSSVLATLQPGQHRLVTWPAGELLVVQGAPGTGKTIIATHRAAYLTHEALEADALESVALIGPSDEWKAHVAPVVADLGVGKATVHSFDGILRDLTGIDRFAPSGESRFDTDWVLGRVLDRAMTFVKPQRGASSRKVARQLVDQLCQRSSPLRDRLNIGVELERWLVDEVQGWKHAARQRRFATFLASAVQAVDGDRLARSFDHLLIDEAQDLRPLEWRVILRSLRPGGTLSIFGDMNQRRCDWSAMSWAQLVTDLDLVSPDSDFEPEVLTVGYRSTQNILRFANQLLPKSERAVHALREGSRPTVTKVPSAEVLAESLREAERLASLHPTGLVAIISTKPTPIADRLRRSDRKRLGTRSAFRKADSTIVVASPEEARGLEFDGVVVVEPADFPENVGRLGQLYTSLTRATKDLSVVHAKGLPKDLRARARS